MLIYKIISPNTDLLYVGKTTCTLKQRLWTHRSDYKRYLAGKRDNRCSAYKVLECGDCSIVLIEETEDGSREGYWIRKLNTCNTRTLDFDMAASCRAYYAANKDDLLEKKKVYYAANRDDVCERQMVYREANKEAINEKQREKIPCSNCGRVVSRSNMTNHKRSQICQNMTNSD